MNNKKVCKQILMGLAISLLLPILVGCKDKETRKEDSQEQLSDANKIEILLTTACNLVDDKGNFYDKSNSVTTSCSNWECTVIYKGKTYNRNCTQYYNREY